MRQLHVLGVSEDGKELILGATKNATKPTHRIPLDDKLRAAARGQLAPFGSDRTDATLTPKEMQARLREGASPEEVAKAAGVPVARVLPFFVPVEAERTRVVDEARAAYLHRSRGADATRPLGQAVDTHLQEVTGLKPESVEWTARRRRDGAWVVSVTYVARGRRSAEWLWQPASRQVTPLDASATRLGSDAVPAAPKRRAKPAPKPAAKQAPPKKAAAKKPAAKKAAPVKAAAKKATVKKAGAAKAAPVKAARTTKAAPARPAKAATRPASAKKAASMPKPAAAKVVKPRRPRVVPAPPQQDEGPFFTPAVIQLPVAPPVEPPLVEEPAVEVEPVSAEVEETGQEQAPARKPGQRVPIPSWSDVLLGVTGNREENRRSG